MGRPAIANKTHDDNDDGDDHRHNRPTYEEVRHTRFDLVVETLVPRAYGETGGWRNRL